MRCWLDFTYTFEMYDFKETWTRNHILLCFQAVLLKVKCIALVCRVGFYEYTMQHDKIELPVQNLFIYNNHAFIYKT